MTTVAEQFTIGMQIEDAREVMEHATMAFVGLEYLKEVAEDDELLLDELSGAFKPEWGSVDDGLDSALCDLAYVIARKAAYVYRLGNGLPIPKKDTTNE